MWIHEKRNDLNILKTKHFCADNSFIIYLGNNIDHGISIWSLVKEPSDI